VLLLKFELAVYVMMVLFLKESSDIKPRVGVACGIEDSVMTNVRVGMEVAVGVGVRVTSRSGE